MSATDQSPDAVLRQIDAIMVELQVLRQSVQDLLQTDPSPTIGSERPAAWDIILAAAGNRQFHFPEDVSRYLREERGTWDD